MNDRYLYRAKRTDNGEWVEGYLFDDGFENGRMFVGGLVIEEYHGTACDDWIITGINFYEVDPSTICACTALKDKNGNLIWENDIVKDNVIFGSVSWDDINARFVIDDIYDGYQDYSDWWSEVEVIGSAIDNPELLEVGE